MAPTGRCNTISGADQVAKIHLRNLAMFAGALAPALAALPVVAQERPPLIWAVQFEELEYRLADGDDLLAWDADAFVGSDQWKLRFLSEAEFVLAEDAFARLENQLLVQRAISDFFDAKAGVRLDTPEGSDQVYGTVGIQGLAPQWIEVDLDLFVSKDGDVSSRLDAEYEILITNRVNLVTSLEFNLPFTDDEKRALGAGAPWLEVGARLGYDLIDRAVTPYIGVSYEKAFGETADLGRAEGEADDTLAAVFGLRLFF